MVFYLNKENEEKLDTHLMHYGPLIQHFVYPDRTKDSINWESFEKSKYFEPFKRFCPPHHLNYYQPSNPDYQNQLSVEKLLGHGMEISEIAANLHVDPKDIEEYIEINRIIEEFEDFDEFIANQKKRD